MASAVTTPHEEKKGLHLPTDAAEDYVGNDYESSNDTFSALIAEDKAHDIQLRTMSWKKATALLFGEQVCLAIMAQSWSYSVLGWVPGIITSLGSFAAFWITSYTLWKFVMKNPHVRDICDIGYLLFGKSRIAYEAVGFMLLCNNIMLIGFHTLTFTRIIQTLGDAGAANICTVVFSVIGTFLGIIMSLPRTLNHISIMSMFSATAMAIAILLFMVFAGIEPHPYSGYGGKYPKLGEKYTYAFPREGTTWVDCLNAVLNIVFLWVPQILFPTFISEMERPQDFPKALGALAVLELFLFIVPPSIGYFYLGQYSKAPAFGSLSSTYKKASFAFVLIPTMVISVIYANVSAKYIYSRVLKGSRHQHSNTVIGWGVWVAVLFVIWWIAFIFAEVIPSMGDFLSLLGAAFDSQYGFIMWSIAYWRLHREELWRGPVRTLMTVIHIVIFFVGLFLLGPGMYAAVEAIIADYAGGTSPAFSCASNFAI